MIGGYKPTETEITNINLEQMTSIDVLQEVIKRKLTGVMVHDDLQTAFDYVNMHGFKREQEYRTLKEMAEFKSLERYLINHYDVMPMKEVTRVEINPLNIKGFKSRMSILPEQKKQIIKTLFEEWLEWEEETIKILEKFTTYLAKNEYNVDAEKVKSLLKDTTMEYKYIERRLIEYSNIDWNLHHIYSLQKEIHEYFKEKTEKEIKVDFS